MWNLYKKRHDRVLYLLVKTVLERLGMEVPQNERGHRRCEAWNDRNEGGGC